MVRLSCAEECICDRAYWREDEAEMLARWSVLKEMSLSSDDRGQRRHVRRDRRDRRKWNGLRRLETLESTPWGLRQQHRWSVPTRWSARRHERHSGTGKF